MCIKQELLKIVGPEHFSDAPEVWDTYSKDFSLLPPGVPNYVVKPKDARQVQEGIKFANERLIPVVPVSSGVHFHGATIPKQSGIVTKMAIKLLPFQPERLEPTGISPHTTLQLPEKRVKWINFSMPSKDSMRQAMYEMAKAEIGAGVTKVPLFWRAIAKAECKEEFWELWSKENEETIRDFHILRVLLIGFASEEQLEYEERVLIDIVTELGGEARRTRPTDESWFKNADSAGMWLMCGSYVSVDYVIETLSHAIPHGENYAELKKKFTPPLMPDYGDPGWFQSFELGHQGYSEFLVYWDPDENTE